MIRALLILAAIGMTGCNTPSLGFRGVDPVTITVDGSTFDVRVKDLRAEAIRTNMQYAPRLGPIGGRATLAIKEVSGCNVGGISGDQAVIAATLNCGGLGPVPKPQPLDYECYSTGGQDVSGGGIEDLVLDCTPVPRQ